jgi:hypothetical protein
MSDKPHLTIESIEHIKSGCGEVIRDRFCNGLISEGLNPREAAKMVEGHSELLSQLFRRADAQIEGFFEIVANENEMSGSKDQIDAAMHKICDIYQDLIFKFGFGK